MKRNIEGDYVRSRIRQKKAGLNNARKAEKSQKMLVDLIPGTVCKINIPIMKG